MLQVDMNYSVKVDKVKLLMKLRENMEKHVKEYEVAKEVYREDVIKEMKKNLKAAQKGEQLVLSINLKAPQSFEKEYKRAIAKFEMSVDSEIFLSDDQFQNYILDEWSWSAAVSASNTFYASKKGF